MTISEFYTSKFTGTEIDSLLANANIVEKEVSYKDTLTNNQVELEFIEEITADEFEILSSSNAALKLIIDSSDEIKDEFVVLKCYTSSDKNSLGYSAIISGAEVEVSITKNSTDDITSQIIMSEMLKVERVEKLVEDSSWSDLEFDDNDVSTIRNMNYGSGVFVKFNSCTWCLKLEESCTTPTNYCLLSTKLDEDTIRYVRISSQSVNDGEWNTTISDVYLSSGDSSVTVIEKTLNEDGTGFVEAFTEEELNAFMNGSILKAKATDIVSYYLTPMLTQQNEEIGMYGVGLSGFVDTETGKMLQVIVMNMDGEISTQVMSTNGKFASAVEITDVSSTATSGTLTDYQLQTLQASDSNYIMFNNEKYYLNDKGHTEGYLTYSHVGVVGENIFVKVITITISTRGWVLIEKVVGEGAGASVSIENDETLVFTNINTALVEEY